MVVLVIIELCIDARNVKKNPFIAYAITTSMRRRAPKFYLFLLRGINIKFFLSYQCVCSIHATKFGIFKFPVTVTCIVILGQINLWTCHLSSSKKFERRLCVRVVVILRIYFSLFSFSAIEYKNTFSMRMNELDQA